MRVDVGIDPYGFDESSDRIRMGEQYSPVLLLRFEDRRGRRSLHCLNQRLIEFVGADAHIHPLKQGCYPIDQPIHHAGDGAVDEDGACDGEHFYGEAEN